MAESVSELTVPTLDATSSLPTTTLGEAKQVEIESSLNTERLGQLSLSNNEYPVHQADWLEINDLLRNKGYDPITLVHQSNYNESHGHVIFTEASVSSLRRILVWCLTDSKYSKSAMDFSPTKKDENACESKTNIGDGVKEKRRVTDWNLEQKIDSLQREIDQLRNSLQAEDISGRKQSKSATNTGEIKFDTSNTNEVEILSLKLCKSKKKCARIKLKMEDLKTANQDLLSQLTAVKEELTMKDNEKKVPANTEVEIGVLEKLAESSRSTAKEQKTNKDIYKSLLELQRNVCPSEKIYKHLKKLDEKILARDIVGLIDHVNENYERLISSPNPLDGFENTELLKLLVGHFMKLFNVNNVDGVLTRMHEVYAKYYEHGNALHAITEILHLGSNIPSYLLVEIIGQLNKARHLLHIRNLNRVIKQIENYDQFYIRFHKLIKEIMYLLAVDSIDHVLPSLRLLLQVT